MITEYYKLSGIDKVAVLFSVIGESVAVRLLKTLSESDIRRIRARSREMDTVSVSLKKQILDEFYLAVMSQKLKNEEPRIIAIALAQVKSEQQIKVLDRLSPEIKGNVLMQLGSLDNIPLEGIVNVASQLKIKSQYLPKGVDFARGGGKSVADILGKMPPFEEEKFLESISQENPELAEEIKKYHLTFEDVINNFPDNLLRDIMNSIELDTIALALKGRNQQDVDKVINNLPQKKQAMYEPVENAVPKRDVDQAKKAIVEAARQMEKDGKFTLEDILGSSDMVE